MNPRVYLAGPDVFLPNPAVRAAELKRVCARHGLLGISPLDPLPGEPAPAPADAASIARRNEAHIRGCDAVLANLSPFRGPGADPGTAYEIGFARALGRPVFGWATTAALHAARVRALSGSTATHDHDGLEIEDFGLFENLMIACAITDCGGTITALDAADPWSDLSAFERCAADAARSLLGALTPA